MKLFETDTEGPPSREEPPVRATPPRPEKRQVMVSLLLTVTVLAGTVIAVFTIFPERHNEILTATVAAHRRPGGWELTTPDDDQLQLWARAVLGEVPPLPASAPALSTVGARALTILDRRAALVRYRIGDGEITYLVQRARDVPRRRIRTRDGDDIVEAWRRGPWTCVVVGPATSADTWRPLLGVP
jgi:hypothetical protein